MRVGVVRTALPAALATGVALAASVVLAPPVQAATAYSLYSYTMTSLTGSTVPNGAAVNTAVPLQLLGSWQPSALGVQFSGDRSTLQSVGRAKPSSGGTLYVAEARAVGVAIRFTYQAPAGGCFSDSPNLTQIGRFGDRVSQVKLQLSNCGTSKTAVYPQCRVAGNQTPTSVWPRTSTRALLNGATYVVHCFEGVTSTGARKLFLRTTQIGSTTTANEWAFNTPGVITSSAYLSVANKYPLPSISNNTDQFNGTVAKVAYCSAPTPGYVSTCLSSEVPTA